MASKPENTFRASVHKYLPKTLHHEKMSNPYSSGTPDDYYSGNGGDLWIEYKYLPRVPQRSNVAPLKLLSPLQARWLRGRYDEGRNVAVIIGCPIGGVILCDRLWEREYDSKEFVSLLRERKHIAEWVTQNTLK